MRRLLRRTLVLAALLVLAGLAAAGALLGTTAGSDWLLRTGAARAGVDVDYAGLEGTLLGRIEMHLVSLVDQQVNLHGHTFRFARGETIHTENSYKYSVAEFHGIAAQAGFATDTVWVDDNRLFSLHLLQTGNVDEV